MIEATFTISASDFNDEVVEKIKMYLRNQQGEVTISFSSRPTESLVNETREAYYARLNKARGNVENQRNLVAFTLEEFEAFVQKLDADHAKNPV